MTERSANDITTPARLVLDAYIIDPVTKLPMAPGVASDGATAAKQDEQTAALGAPDDSAWESGHGTHTALLKTIATKSLDTAPVAVALGQSDYETVAASQTDQMLGATGAAGDYLAGLLVVPASTSPGAVSIEDGSTNITVFAGGASSVSNLVPFFIPLGIASVSGGWEVTTGASVSVIAVGEFT